MNHISIGATKETVLAARAAVKEILDHKMSSQNTKRIALETMAKICEVKNTTISGCTFKTKGK